MKLDRMTAKRSLFPMLALYSFSEIAPCDKSNNCLLGKTGSPCTENALLPCAILLRYSLNKDNEIVKNSFLSSMDKVPSGMKMLHISVLHPPELSVSFTTDVLVFFCVIFLLVCPYYIVEIPEKSRQKSCSAIRVA